MKGVASVETSFFSVRIRFEFRFHAGSVAGLCRETRYVILVDGYI